MRNLSGGRHRPGWTTTPVRRMVGIVCDGIRDGRDRTRRGHGVTGGRGVAPCRRLLSRERVPLDIVRGGTRSFHAVFTNI